MVLSAKLKVIFEYLQKNLIRTIKIPIKSAIAYLVLSTNKYEKIENG